MASDKKAIDLPRIQIQMDGMNIDDQEGIPFPKLTPSTLKGVYHGTVKNYSQSAPNTPDKEVATNAAPVQPARKLSSQFIGKNIGRYKFGKTLGSGSTGKVKLAIDGESGAKVAVKVIARDLKDPNNAREIRIAREAAIMRLLNHPNITRMYDLITTPDLHYMIFEYVTGGQVLDYIIAHGRLKEKVARKFFRQLVSAVAYCHENNVVHRDLKIENVLIDKDGNIKLIDFGLSNFFDENYCLKTFCGSLYFAAPELLSGKLYVGPEVDIWSLGVMLYVLVVGKVPFEDKTLPLLHEKIKRGQTEVPSFLSAECRDLIQRLLLVDPSKRIIMEQVMNHPWVIKESGVAVQSLVPDRLPLYSIDPDISKEISDNFCFQFEQRFVQHVLEAAIRDHDSYYHHPVISLYHLIEEKKKNDKKSNVMTPVATPVLPPQPPLLTVNKSHTRSVSSNSSLWNSLKTRVTRSQTLTVISEKEEKPMPRSKSGLAGPITAREEEAEIPPPAALVRVKSVFIRGLFSVSTTTSLPPNEIYQRIFTVLCNNQNITSEYDQINSIFSCVYYPSIKDSNGLSFDIQIVKLAFLSIYGVQFHRTQGDTWIYKSVCHQLLKELKL